MIFSLFDENISLSFALTFHFGGLLLTFLESLSCIILYLYMLALRKIWVCDMFNCADEMLARDRHCGCRFWWILRFFNSNFVTINKQRFLLCCDVFCFVLIAQVGTDVNGNWKSHLGCTFYKPILGLFSLLTPWDLYVNRKYLSHIFHSYMTS